MCLEYTQTYICGTKPTTSDAVTLLNSEYTISRDDLQSGCTAAVADRHCAMASETSVAAGGTWMINGLAVTKDCWAWQREYSCLASSFISDCGSHANDQSCTQIASACLSKGGDGACVHREKRYRCGGAHAPVAQQGAREGSREWPGERGDGCGARSDNRQPVSGGRLRSGFHFYCDPSIHQKRPATDKTIEVLTSADAMQKLAADKLELNEARAVALVNPTHKSVVAYMRLQKERTQRAVWQINGLDYQAEHPQSAIGKQVVNEQRNRQQKATLVGLRQTHGLIYVGTSSCAICRAYGPVLRDFAAQNAMTVLAVSADGSPLTGWPEAVTDNGQLANMGLRVNGVPVTALFETATKKVTVLGFGFISQETLAERIHTLTKRQVGDGF